jgi:hypothetical protein
VAGPGEAHPPQAKHRTPKDTRQRDLLNTRSIPKPDQWWNDDKIKITITKSATFPGSPAKAHDGGYSALLKNVTASMRLPSGSRMKAA